MPFAVSLLASALLGAALPTPIDTATALFAGGSFWCLEPVFEGLPGVDSVQTGYAGPAGAAPGFDQATAGTSAYVEAVKVWYHPKRIGYAALLDAYWRNIDPTRVDGQFTDVGSAYRAIIYYGPPAELKSAEASRKRLSKSKRFAKPIVTEIQPAPSFFPAEAEHQDYYRKSAGRYHAYYEFSGRKEFLGKAWGGKTKSTGAKPAALERGHGPAPARAP